MQQFYIRVNGEEKGPVNTDQLKALAHKGHLHRNDEVRRVGKEKWYKATEVAGLFSPEDDAAQDAPVLHRPIANEADLQAASSRPVLDADDEHEPHVSKKPFFHRFWALHLYVRFIYAIVILWVILVIATSLYVMFYEKEVLTGIGMFFGGLLWCLPAIFVAQFVDLFIAIEDHLKAIRNR